MNQSALAFQLATDSDSDSDSNPVTATGTTPASPEKAASGDADSSSGFQIGWDHAHHALVPPIELLTDGTDVAQGWMAGRAVFGRRTLAPTRTVRLWLQLRTLAWRSGLSFDALQVTPNYLAQIHTDRCPVLRLPLGGLPGTATAAVVERLNPQAGFAAGNLAVMSQAAASARVGLGLACLVRRARQAELCGDDIAGLSAAAWWRLAALTAFATPALSHFEAARMPLAVLPPNRVRVLNSCLALQTVLTRLFLQPGWAARARTLAARLPAHTLRHDFNLFVGAVAPRVLEAGTDPKALRLAMEDAWLNERVQRRWQHFVQGLGEVACESLLNYAVSEGLPGIRTLTHAPQQAVAGWGLAEEQVQAEPRSKRRNSITRTVNSSRAGAGFRQFAAA